MADVTIQYRFKVAGHTAAQWTSGNPVLLERELGFETDTLRYKLGDGSTAWNSLSYANGFTQAEIEEFARDAVGAALTAGSPKIDITIDDGADTITLDVDEAEIDHGSIDGLGDDDHTQYALLAGRGGAETFAVDVEVPDEAYGAGWNASVEVPTKNAVYDKIEALATTDLSDVESGTFTPVIADAASGGNEATVGGSRAEYVKSGKIVVVRGTTFGIDTTGMTAGNDVFITGLPFTAAAVGGTNYWDGSIGLSQISFTGYALPDLIDDTNYLRLRESASGATTDWIIVSEITSGTAQINFTIVYEAA